MKCVSDEFEPIFKGSPFINHMGPILIKKSKNGYVLGLTVEEKHCNASGTVHGGVLSSLADISLGYNAAFSGEELLPNVTVSLTIDYAGSAKLGEWVEVETDIQKVGRRMIFANCNFVVNSKHIAHASGVFAIMGA